MFEGDLSGLDTADLLAAAADYRAAEQHAGLECDAEGAWPSLDVAGG